MIKVSIDSQKHTFTVDLDRGEQPLPWSEDPELRPYIPSPQRVIHQAPAKEQWPKPSKTGRGGGIGNGKGKEIWLPGPEQRGAQATNKVAEKMTGGFPENRGKLIQARDRSVSPSQGKLPVRQVTLVQRPREPLDIASGSTKIGSATASSYEVAGDAGLGERNITREIGGMEGNLQKETALSLSMAAKSKGVANMMSPRGRYKPQGALHLEGSRPSLRAHEASSYGHATAIDLGKNTTDKDVREGTIQT
ncbi:hypothetical protein J5N97_003374 [Dioscorea zingiberensis]|uniref:Uncharacterized protein n=1 Tax=Dioscorea zingiberensis TaxID=325984 RepID=A0A9D5D4K3_9LILI|nr:hypothetical protein J5N97_003374 [Dioscorea zingiberensis]